MVKRFNANDFIEMPWKNGGGITTELYRLPDPSDPSQFLIRISQARVEQDGPFSLFPGIDRKLLILKGNGCKLTFHDRVETLLPGRILEFPGEAVITCSLINGPLIDFNVMMARKFGRASLSISNEFRPGNQFIYHPRTETLYQFKENEEVILDHQNEDHLVIRITSENSTRMGD